MANLLKIKSIAEQKNISLKDIAEHIGITPTGLSKIIRENSTKTVTLEKIALKLKVPVSVFFETEDLPVEKVESVQESKPQHQAARKKIPFYDGVSVAGNQSVASLDPQTNATEYVEPGDWFRDANAAMRVHGDSMVPDYHPGSIVALREVSNKDLVIFGQDYVIETDEYRVIKRLQKSDLSHCWLCCSANQDLYEASKRLIHEPFDVPVDQVRRLFRVVGCVCRNESSGIISAPL